MLVDKWIDIHGHFFPPMSDAERHAIADGLRQNCWHLDHIDQWTPEATLAFMDRTGIQMQMLSYVPSDAARLREANAYGAQLVRDHPDRLGLLAALPTDDPDACLAEIARAMEELDADGFAVQHIFNGAVLSDPNLEPVWVALNELGAVVFAHPNAYGSAWNRPAALMDVAFQSAHVIADLLYRGVFRRHPDIQFVFTHSGGAFPAMSGRLLLLGTEPWVPNPENVTLDEMREAFGRMILDTAATMPTGLSAALAMTGPDKIVYGSDCGVPCSLEGSLVRNIEALLAFDGLSHDQIQAIGRNALALFPKARARIEAAAMKPPVGAG
jgi:predicted TIM-barrel fold metal-dependent hydrolase